MAGEDLFLEIVRNVHVYLTSVHFLLYAHSIFSPDLYKLYSIGKFYELFPIEFFHSHHQFLVMH